MNDTRSIRNALEVASLAQTISDHATVLFWAQDRLDPITLNFHISRIHNSMSALQAAYEQLPKVADGE